MSEPEVQDVLNQVRELVEKIALDHEARIRALESKKTIVNAIVSGIVSLAVAVVASLAGCGATPDPEVVQFPEPEMTPERAMLASAYVEARPEYEPGSLDEALCEMFGCGWSGTAWWVGKDTLVTAGHVCDSAVPTQVSYGSHEAWAEVEVAYDDDVTDVCVLKTKEPNFWAIWFDLASHSKMQIGDPVWTWGYPSGEPSLQYGYYTGRVEATEENGPRLIVALTGWYGASGSAVMNEAGDVVGVLVEMYTANGMVTRLVPVEEVRKALDSLGGP